ncbi:transposase [Calothrix sp. NIES-2098]|nr:transposase [Calothrix sp. NIES-2098]
MKELVNIHFPDAEIIRLVMDNLNTHTIGVLYEVFAPAAARRIAKIFEIHHTPKHGSWLNMVESELSVLVRQCLQRRIPNYELAIAIIYGINNRAHHEQYQVERFTFN